MNNDKQNRGFWKSLKDKGYYIALILCAAAIGISGYVYYRSNQSKTPDSLAGTGTAPSVTGQTATTPAGANRHWDDAHQAHGAGRNHGSLGNRRRDHRNQTGKNHVARGRRDGGCLCGGQAGLQ